MRIYAIDDERAALSFLKTAILEAAPDAELLTFSLPSEMLEAAQTVMPDVAFLDIELPGIGGLDLAKRLLALKPDLNVIFVTGFENYAIEALNLYASGYIMKPAEAEEVRRALDHLRYPVESHQKIQVMTFGNFSINVNGNPVVFRSAKSKELLAFLVDRQGASVTRKEAAGVLYEDCDFDRYHQKELSRAAKWLAEDLAAVDAAEMFIDGEKEYAVSTETFDCDAYNFLRGSKKTPFLGEYMEQYSWGEDRKYIFEEKSE